MEMTFLGTSSGTPTKRRNVTGLAIKESQGKEWYLVDCGEATQHQLLHTSLSVNALAGIFITHVHGVHCYGLPGLLASAAMNGREKPLTIVAPKGIQEWFEATQKHTQLHLSYKINFIAVESLSIEKFGEFEVSAVALAHRVPSFAYRFTARKMDRCLDIAKLEALQLPKGPLWGKLKAGDDVEFGGQTLKSCEFVTQNHKHVEIVVSGDNSDPELLREFCRESDVLIHEATFTEDMAQQALAVGHSYGAQVARFANDVKVPHLILTHFSPRYQDDDNANLSVSQINNEAALHYHGDLFTAQDFHRYYLNDKGKLSKLSE